MVDRARILVAGVGNVLRGDDGFGVVVLKELEREASPDVAFLEAGIAGIGLVQSLMDGYEALVVVDALDRGAPHGQLFVLEPDQAALRAAAAQGVDVDLHQADPETALKLAARLGVLPPRVWIVGCQARDYDELGAGLSPPVASAVPLAVARIREILALLSPAPPGASVAATDEILQVMFWMRGERIAAQVTAKDLTRLVSLSEGEVERVLERMVELGLLERQDGRYALSDSGALEGGRRFADEFADLTRGGHYECNDPDCDCRASGRPEDCKHKVEGA